MYRKMTCEIVKVLFDKRFREKLININSFFSTSWYYYYTYVLLSCRLCPRNNIYQFTTCSDDQLILLRNNMYLPLAFIVFTRNRMRSTSVYNTKNCYLKKKKRKWNKVAYTNKNHLGRVRIHYKNPVIFLWRISLKALWISEKIDMKLFGKISK